MNTEKIINKLIKIKSEGKLKIDAVSGAYGKGVTIEATSPYAKIPFFCDEAKGAITELEKRGIKFDALDPLYLVIATEEANRANHKKFLDFYNKLMQEPKALGSPDKGSCRTIKREQIELDALLFGAAENGRIEEAKYVLEEGADANAKNNEGKTALMYASMNGRKEVARLLVDSKAYVNASSKAGWTALMYASRWGHKEIAELLVNNGAAADAKDSSGWTALMKAAITGHKEVAELLIKAGADVNAKSNRNQTALMWALHNKRKEVAELLRKHGAIEG